MILSTITGLISVKLISGAFIGTGLSIIGNVVSNEVSERCRETRDLVIADKLKEKGFDDIKKFEKLVNEIKESKK